MHASEGIVARPKVASHRATDDEPQPGVRSTPMSWMARLHWVFAIDLSRRPRGGGELQVIAAITEPGVIARLLEHIGLDGCVQRARPAAGSGELMRTRPAPNKGGASARASIAPISLQLSYCRRAARVG